MKMITAHEVARKTEQELTALFHLATHALAMSNEDSAQRRNALGSLEVISRACMARICGMR